MQNQETFVVTLLPLLRLSEKLSEIIFKLVKKGPLKSVRQRAD